LKKGVKFHNGKELDSGDVKWSWERIKAPAHMAGARQILTTYLDTIETPDPYTVVANLTQPYFAFLIANAWCNTVILPKDSIPKDVIWGFTPTFKPPTVAPPGTGPFQLVEFQQKHRSVFKAFKDYHQTGLPYLDEVIFMVISEDAPRTMAVRSGDVDYIYGAEDTWLSKVMKGKMDKLNQAIHYEKEDLMVYSILSNAALTIYLNNHDKKGDSPFKDVRVRQAMDYCIDRPKLCQALYGDLLIPTAQGYHWSNSPWGYEDVKPKVPDIEKAKQLLKEAGYPNGLDVEFKFTPSWGKNDQMAQIVQQMAGKAGFRIKLTPQVGVQYWINLRKYSFHMLVYTIGADDPMSMYYPSLHTDPAPPYRGYSQLLGVKDPTMDQLLDDMAGEIDLKKRKDKFKKVVQRCNEMSYCLPYGIPIGANVWRPRLKNFKPDNYFQPEQAFKEAWVES
jgi:peptide/nickel transport system substrate-binding protein